MSKALLVISFGTSYEETRKRTLEEIEKTLTEAFPDRVFYRAWTSGRILKKLRAAGGPVFDSLEEALERMERDGVTDVLAQPTFMVDGYEMQTALDTLRARLARFARMKAGKPLLADGDDIGKLAAVLERRFGGAVGPDEMLAFMGHGSNEMDRNVYTVLEDCFRRDGFPRFTVGTVEFAPGFSHVLDAVRERKPRRVVLAPLMVVAGDHATNDMAGEEDDSWKKQILREGVEARCVLEGLGEYPEIRGMYLEHAKAAELKAE